MGKKYGGERDDELRKIIQVNDGFIIVGSTSSYGRGGWDVWLIKIDENGNEIWNKTYGWYDMDWGKKIIRAKDGYMIFGDTTSTVTGWNDIVLIKIDENGNEIWNKTYGGGRYGFIPRC